MKKTIKDLIYLLKHDRMALYQLIAIMIMGVYLLHKNFAYASGLYTGIFGVLYFDSKRPLQSTSHNGDSVRR